MSWKPIPLLVITMISTTLPSLAETANQADGLQEFEKRAGKFNAVIALPEFETMTNQVEASTRQTITNGNAALDKIAGLDPSKLTFGNTVRALDDLAYQIGLTANRLSLIKETSMDAPLREASTETLKTLEEWSVG